MGSVNLRELLKPVALDRGIPVFLGGKETIEYVDLSPDEEQAVTNCVQWGAKLLQKISPSIASEFLEHLDIFKIFAGVAKSHFPTEKPIRFPSEPGSIGVNLLFPQAIKYAATASSTYPCYTSYTTNKWEISLTAGTTAYLFGDGTNYYKASPTTDKHELIVIMKDGVIEVGSTPKIVQMRLWTEIASKYGIWTPQPLVDVSVEPNKSIYQYNTLGVLPIYHDLGVQWAILPEYSGTAVIKLIGVVFYEHDLFSNITHVS